MLTVVAEDGSRREDVSLLDDVVREGARRMLAAALQAEVDAYLAELADERDERGRTLVVRNGHAQPREVMTSAGAIEVVAPRVNDKRVDEQTGQRRRFRSVVRLTKQWTDDYHAFCQRDLSGVDFVYVWVDGIHVRVRLEDDKLCLAIVGVRADGTKEWVALADGYRESAGSWTDLQRDCARRGMRAPALAVGDGALGFWAALREVFPETREQRDWVHRVANVLGALPKSARPGAKAARAEIYNAEDRRHAHAAATISDDLDELLAFFDYPAEHWIHLRTSNPIGSTFATVRHRTRVTKGPGSRAAGLAMAFKLIESAQQRWRAVDAPHLVALVRAGVLFDRGVLGEREPAAAA